MSEQDQNKLSRVQRILTALLRHELTESLTQVEGVLARWRSGNLGPFEAHAEVVRHAARTDRIAARIARLDPDGAGPVLRNAYDAGLVTADEFRELVGKSPEDVEPSPPPEVPEVSELPDKREFTDELLEEGAVLLHVDARRSGVSVPEHLLNDAKLVLRFGYGLAPAIVDLEVDDDAMSGTLTFGGVPHHCVLPWDTIYAVVSEATSQAMVWPDDVPSEVLDQVGTSADESDGANVEASEPEPAAPAETSSNRRAYLKLVE